MERFYRLTRLPETCWGRYSKSSTNKCQSTGWMVQSLETILVSVWSCCQRNGTKFHIQCFTYRRPLLGPCWKHLLTLLHWISKDLCWPKYFQQGEGPSKGLLRILWSISKSRWQLFRLVVRWGQLDGEWLCCTVSPANTFISPSSPCSHKLSRPHQPHSAARMRHGYCHCHTYLVWQILFNQQPTSAIE